jgi:hypothetical protein
MRTKVNMMKDIFFNIYFNNPVYSSLQLRDLIIHTQLVSQSMSRSNAKPPIKPTQRNPPNLQRIPIRRPTPSTINMNLQIAGINRTANLMPMHGGHSRGQHTLTAQ